MKKFNKSLLALVLLQVIVPLSYASYEDDQRQASNGKEAVVNTKDDTLFAKQSNTGVANKTAVNSTAVSASQNATGNDPVSNLLGQARFWHDKYQPAKAQAALKRVLLINPNHEEAMYLASLWAYEAKDYKTSKEYKQKLQSLVPESSYIQQLESMSAVEKFSQEQLNHARTLASSGNMTAAIAEYQKLFSGTTPPKALVSEYYLTMSGDPNYYDRAVAGITDYIKKNKTDINAQITYAKILTYRQNSIRNGIAVLDYYAPKSADADNALRQALLWLKSTENDKKYYDNYALRHPNDVEVKKHYDDIVLGALNEKAGEKAKNNQREAINDYLNILKKDPNNQLALEALGYLYMNSGEYLKAYDYLNMAAMQGGSKGPKLLHDANLCKAKLELKNGDYAKALDKLDEVLSQNEYDVDALALQAQIYKQQKNTDKAVLSLKKAMNADPENPGINEMLYYLYRDSGRANEAKDLLASMPDDVASKIKNATAVKTYVDPIPSIRNKASVLYANGQSAAAIDELQSAIKTHPNATWIRYDLAKYLGLQGYKTATREQVAYLTRPNASNEDLFAAATLMSENGEYKAASNVLSRVTSDSLKVRNLRESILLNESFNRAKSYLNNGNSKAAYNTLETLRPKVSSMTTAQLGQYAYLYSEAGDSAKALEYADMAAQRPVDDSSKLDDYADVIAVYNNTGNYEKAKALTKNSSLVSNSSSQMLSNLDIGDSIRKADALRSMNRYADAYDELYPMIENHPDNDDLKMAMARIYHDNGDYNEAYSIYENILQRKPTDQKALQGAINATLSNHDYQRATELAENLNATDDPRLLTLLARIDEKNKNYTNAISKLNHARGLIDTRYAYSNQQVASDPNASLGSNGKVHLRGNPFVNKGDILSKNTKKVALPWQQKASVSAVSGSMTPKQRQESIDEINYMLRRLNDKVATSVKFNVEANQKDGEDGLSKLDTLKIPVTVSIPVLGGAQFSMTATPVTMNAGSVGPDSSEKFGTNALSIGVQNLVTRINTLKTQYNAITIEDDKKSFINANGLNVLGDADVTTLLDADLLDGADYPLTTAKGREALMAYLSSFTDAKAVMKAVNAVQKANTVMYSARAKRESGVGFSAMLSDDNYKLDFGITPIGKDGTTVEAGAFYKYPLSSNSEVRFNLERRAMTDSLLSYFGYEDKMSGTYWGGVTKNGGSVEYAFDDGFLGYSLKGSLYKYKGKNVLSNSSYGLNSTVYVHPFKPSMYEDMTIGISLSYEDYKHNENHFSFGHGGYFSPKNYYIAAIPFTYTKRTEKTTFSTNLTLGYQSYTNEETDYFPTNSIYQSELNNLVSMGLAKRSRYEREDQSGVGGSARINVEHYLLDDLVIGGQVSYSTFGEYKEMYEMLYIKSIIGGL